MTGGRGRRRGSDRDPGNVMFGTIGWLFADLMLALALAFIVATTVLQPLPPGEPVPGEDRPTPTTAPREPVLSLEAVTLTIPIDVQGLLADDEVAIEGLRQQVLSNTNLTDRDAGIVLTFGGTDKFRDRPLGQRISKRVNAVLMGLGADGFVFDKVVVFKDYLGDGPQNEVIIEIYLFKV